MSGIIVTPISENPADIRLWDDYVATHPDSTVYHLSAWRSIFAKSFGYRTWLLAAREADSGLLRGILPLYLVKPPWNRRLVSVPFRDRGGPLWTTADAFTALVLEARRIAHAVGARSIWLKTVRFYPPELVKASNLIEHCHWVHSVLGLDDLTVDVLWKRIGDKTRNMIRQAARHDLACAPMAADEESVLTWYRLHLATQKRLGLPPFPLVFFDTMAKKLAKNGAFGMLGVKSGSATVAATILLLHKRTGIYGYAASDSAGHHRRANDLMLFTAIRWLLENGYGEFDMGSDSPQQKSLLFFKRKWLATQTKIPHYAHGQARQVIADSSDYKYAALRRSFALLPAPVLAAIGRVITKYFG
jgi:CelD/BcsL family acetyltransferase involved in cellulose biosynthesis